MSSDPRQARSVDATSASAAPQLWRLEELARVAQHSSGYASLGSFEVGIAGHPLKIPVRIYCDPRTLTTELTAEDAFLASCLCTRHYDGYVRERCLRGIILGAQMWVPAFVIKLLGEYVVEILQVIDQNLPYLDMGLYAGFLNENRSFYDKTVRQVVSYWDCYYRSIPPQEYVGFRIVRAFDRVISISSKGRLPRAALSDL